MKRLTEFLHRLPVYRHILDATRHQISPIAVTGLASVHRSYLAARLRRDTERPIVILCADEGESRRLLQDLDALLDEKAALLTAREFVFHAGTASKQDQQGRLSLFHALRMGEVPLLVVTVEALLQRTLPPAQFDLLCRTLKPGDHENLTSLLDALCRMGYTRCEQVEGVGQFAVRGGILDVFSSAHPKPVRMEFFGDEIDSMSLFDPATQRRVDSLLSATLLPAGEVLPPEEGELPDPPDLCLPTRYAMATATDYLPENALVLVSESARAADRAKSWLWQLEEDIKFLLESNILDGHHAEFALSYERLCTQLSKFSLIWLDSFPTTAYPITPQSIFSVDAKQLTGFGKSLDALVEDLKLYHSFAVVILVPTERRGENLQMMLHDRQINALLDPGLHALPEPGQIVISLGGLSSGFEYPNAHVAVLTEGAPPSKHTPRIPKSNRQKLESYSDLSVGALVVHEHHGVGRFVGMVKMTIDGIVKDYIKLQFAGEDVLYVPAMQLDVISKYIGGGEDPDSKRLSKLGGIEWGRAKTRAKKAAKDLAKGLIRLYAQRQRQSGFSFSPDSPWQREFEDRFEYEETDDQLRCIEEIKRDMERPIPMDRLLCGDVGYGKTEVAFRAVMKCILDGKQAAILVPTTVLAQQHYMTALHRFEGTAVSIEMLSRFRTPTQARNILKQTEEGQVDLLIGTHKLLQKSVKFHDLGLLVVDEEQRFGVSHKERLKEMSKQVDVLVLSATPIPRTLNMALSGLRDMSSLEEPPTSRQPVQTYVLEHDFTVLCDAMRRELERGGQVYYLHNRVETIDRCAAQIASFLAHDVRVAVAHGKMDQDELGEVMSRMTDGEIDILVCTTIIETGIDLPNVNTLIVEDADRLGLAQLHQLRGRVGRSARKASAYMTYRAGKVLSEISERRLSAIREFAAFGSGFKIAMRDLEIRGAGNILGPEQSGFLSSVGYDMYLRLLEEAVLEEQGIPIEKIPECSADLNVPANLAEQYIPSSEQRMDLYRRIAKIKTETDADEITDELVDRYGDPPRAVNNLISIALLRAQAAGCGITEISQKDTLVRFYVPATLFARISILCAEEKYHTRLIFSATQKSHLAFRLKKGDDVLRIAQRVVKDFSAIPDKG